jgi:hypothetical protein
MSALIAQVSSCNTLFSRFTQASRAVDSGIDAMLQLLTGVSGYRDRQALVSLDAEAKLAIATLAEVAATVEPFLAQLAQDLTQRAQATAHAIDELHDRTAQQLAKSDEAGASALAHLGRITAAT